MLWTLQNKVLEDINTLITASYVDVKLHTVSRMSKVDYQNKVLPAKLVLMERKQADKRLNLRLGDNIA